MWTVSVAVVVVVICLWLVWRKRKFSLFKDLGIPGPEPSLLFGNMGELTKEGTLECHKRWLKKYGRIVGYYFGSQPRILVTDVEILKKIQVSEFRKFLNRPPLFLAGRKKPTFRVGFQNQLTNIRDKRWKDIRSIMTPTFTTSKMKMMAPIINEAIDTLLENIDAHSKKNSSFDIYKLYQTLTMDVIGRTAFGIHTDVQRNPDDPFLRTARIFLSGNASSFLNILSFSFPELTGSLWSKIGLLKLIFKNKGKNPVTEFVESVDNVIKLRRTDKSYRRNDLMQLMMDAEMSEADLRNVNEENLTAGSNESGELGLDETKDEAQPPSKILRHMSDEEILDNAVLFFLAGYETTSTALAFTTHFLVHYPEIQERVRKEVNDLISEEGELDYTSLQKLQYLDQVFSESLRMYPPVYLFVSREIGEDVEFDSMKFKKGLAVQVAVHALHHDPEYWPDPEKFDPERFSPENKSRIHPMAWQPFGAGPRNCLGMRFAQMEAKLALAKILKEYKLVPCEETDKDPITLRVTNVIMTPEKGINVRAVPC